MSQAIFDPETVDLDAMLKRLHLANTRRQWSQFCEQAEREDWSPRRLLAVMFAEEIAQRKNTRIKREVRQAGFPFFKTIDDFDFSLQSTLKLTLLGSYLGPELMAEGRCLVLTGKTGRGKTHMAIAIAYRAIQNGFSARCITAADLIDDLSDAGHKARFRETLAAYTQPHILVIDEVGYLDYGPDAANVLFHVVNNRHTQRRPMIFTTNKSPFTEWGDVLHDHDLAEAIVDRILDRGRLIVMDGPSYRTRHLDGLDRGTTAKSHEPARISGIDRPEIPEPASSDPYSAYRTRARSAACLPRNPADRQPSPIAMAPGHRRRSWCSGQTMQQQVPVLRAEMRTWSMYEARSGATLSLQPDGTRGHAPGQSFSKFDQPDPEAAGSSPTTAGSPRL